MSNPVTGVESDDTGSEFGANEWLVDELYERYQHDRNSVDRSWWPVLESYHPVNPELVQAITLPGAHVAEPEAPTADLPAAHVVGPEAPSAEPLNPDAPTPGAVTPDLPEPPTPGAAAPTTPQPTTPVARTTSAGRAAYSDYRQPEPPNI